ncbi:MAG: hypothetical protein EP329_06585 [Deltaproteobacteria bacterium]|nr:MAG: hypothetical protein EP329_06585 [Deltaproteobacteria bacterium]
MLRRGLLALVPLFALGSTACDPIEVIPDPVVDEDQPPVWDISNPGRQSIVEGKQFKITLTATDSDGDAVQYILKQKAGDSMTINAETGEIVWVPGFSTVTECKGTETFSVTVIARTKPADEFVDIEMQFNLVVLGDLDEDGESDVDDTGAVVDTDFDGDELSNVDEDAAGTDECVADTDGDGVDDGGDTCKLDKNPPADCDSNPATPDEQCDKDNDGLGDGCDPFPECDLNDPDVDGVDNCLDNCPGIANPKKDCDGVPATPIEQCDNDDDGVGDECDPCPKDKINDPDLDGLCAFDEDGNVTDNCNGDLNGDGEITSDEIFTDQSANPSPHFNTDQADDDNDDIGDVCDVCPHDATNDEDEDGVCQDVDNCPDMKNEPSDCDDDASTADEQCDLDGDNIGDVCDSNIDGDCKENSADNCPEVANCEDDNTQIDTDEDGDGDACDDDDDDDDVLDVDDNCPLVANAKQTDVDGDNIGFQCDSSVVIPSDLHVNGLAAARVSGAARGGTTALAFESKETLCNSAQDCPTPGVLIVDDTDTLYMKRYDSADADSNWLNIGFGGAGELGDPFVSQAGVAYFPTLAGGNYGLRRIEGENAAGVFQTTVVSSDVTFHDLPDGTTAAQFSPSTGNPGLYHLEDLTSGDPKLLKSAGGYPAGVPPLGPFEIPCGKNGCQTSTVAADAVKMGIFYGKDNTVYAPFVSASTGEIEIMTYTMSSGAFEAVNDVPSGSSTTLLKSTDLQFIAEDPNTGTPWYCMRKGSGGAQLIHLAGGNTDRACSTSFFAPCSQIKFTLSPGGVWFMEGPAPTASQTRLSFFDTNGTSNATQDVYGPGAAPTSPATTDTLQLYFAGNSVFIERGRFDGQQVQPEWYSSIEYWAPGQVGAKQIVSSNAFLYNQVVSTNDQGWIGIVGRDAPSYATVQNIIARRYKAGVTTSNAQQATLRTDSTNGSQTSKPVRAWVGPLGEVWAFYKPATNGSFILSVFPEAGMGTPPAASGTGLATSSLDNGANVTFHPAATVVSVLTNKFNGSLRYAVSSTTGTTLHDFAPAVAFTSSVQVVTHDDFLADLVPITGGGNHWVTYATGDANYSIAKVETGGIPTLNVVETGLLSAPHHVQIGPGSGNGKPWFFYDKDSGFNVAWINGVGNFDGVVMGAETIDPIYQILNGRPLLWGISFKKGSTTPTNVCRLPGTDSCWTAVDGTTVHFGWSASVDVLNKGFYVNDAGVAHLVWVDDQSPPNVTLWRSTDAPVTLDSLP